MIKGVFFDFGDTLVKEGSVETLPNAREVLEVLADRYRLAIICNTDASGERVREILSTAGIKKYFDLIVVSSEVGLRKPDGRARAHNRYQEKVTCELERPNHTIKSLRELVSIVR